MQLRHLKGQGCKLLPQCGIQTDNGVVHVEDKCENHVKNPRIIRNLAREGTALQDSTYIKHFSNAEKAIDGNTNGDYYKGSVTHTKFERYAWWQVKLVSYSLITKIKVYNRSDG